ncbi:quercetin dioxygenase-like cupin family protein [Nocardioides daedukensis]|uniref:Quercetin dioxygenase-like cupin family protein n=1 Tax=Nocardioides daedukensis TaxID=634462 RepID=A0A7Y9RXJ9_9ACTN|nr:cysteine dioxygenase family protein [Nocardioides daedukensis]NYG58521.1 quercetin dioxygenase-like cupin family protein [Nocardioides daedukensis]
MTTLTVLPLLQTLREFARDPDLLHLHDPTATERQWTELITTDDLQIWLISWPTEAETGWHDHGTAGGAFTTIAGRLTEHSWDGAEHIRSIGTGDAWSFAPGHIHNVRNLGAVPAISVHAYSPRLTTMTRYQLSGSRIEAIGVEQAGVQW